MGWLIVVLAALVMLVLAVVMAVVLGKAHKAWEVREDPTIQAVEEALAGLDCGQCGHPTCNDYAHAIVEGGEEINKCLPGGKEATLNVAEILNVKPPAVGEFAAIVHCGATVNQRKGLVDYQGERTCAAAEVTPGVQACVYGCLGLGDCERICPYDAIHVIEGLAVVDFHKCTACGKCVTACPRNIISIEHMNDDRIACVACCNRDSGKETRRVCPVGCIACGLCEKNCELYTVSHNLAGLDHEN
ncbi:MAG: RnfABCDGE type electron transport complex subunit B, partial [Phycisphaerae bacterium]